MNEDRHLNNFGIIRDVNTLKWVDVAPIFDNGQSLNVQDYNEDEVVTLGHGRLFYELKPFDEIIKVVRNLKRINIEALEDIPEEFDKLLHQYQNITHMSDRRIQNLCILLQRQIDQLQAMIEDS